VRVAIVEDEAVVARRLERMLRAIAPVTRLDRAETLDRALELIRGRAIDLLFLDLNLNGRDGFQLLEEAAAGAFQTVVVSAHHDQAIRAFDYGIADFVTKPWSEERLRLAVDRARSRRPANPASAVVIRKGRELRSIRAADIVWVQAADDYAELHLAGGATHLHEKTLAAMEALLPATFLRIHRSFLVNLRSVRGLRASAVVLLDGTVLPLGRVYRDAVRARLTGSAPP
jgi:DNA-binding LytR/AlgR family response regulator